MSYSVAQWQPKCLGDALSAGRPGVIKQCASVGRIRTGHFSQITNLCCASTIQRFLAFPSTGAPSLYSLTRKSAPVSPWHRLRVAASDGQSGGDSVERGTSAADSLLDALRGAERSFTEHTRHRVPPPLSADASQSEVDPGTGLLLEALRALEHPKPDQGSAIRTDSPSSQPSQSQLPSPPSPVGPSNHSTSRAKVQVGSEVDIVLKKDQANGRLTRGVVAKILTNSADHPRGIKVRLKGGEVGRIHDIISAPSGSSFSAFDGDPQDATPESATGGSEPEERGEGFSGRTGSEPGVQKGATIQTEVREQGTKIFLTGLPREATNEDLREALRGVAGVRDAFLVLNKQRQCQGYGFVQLEGDVEAGLAKLNELELRGQRMIAAVSIEKKRNESGVVTAANSVKGMGGGGAKEPRLPQQKRPAESQAPVDGARLLLEAFRGMQEKSKGRPARVRKRGGRGGSRFRATEDDDSGMEVSTSASEEAESQMFEEAAENDSGEPRVITISDDTPQTADPNQPSMGQLVMAAMERAREKKGVKEGPTAVAASKAGETKGGDVSSDDEGSDSGPPKPLWIDPNWTAALEALSQRLEEVKRMPIDIRS